MLKLSEAIKNKIIKNSHERIEDLKKEIQEEKELIKETRKKSFVKCPFCKDGSIPKYVGCSCGDSTDASPYISVSCTTCSGKGYLSND